MQTNDLSKCGTYAGVRRHQRRDEEICAPCGEARRQYYKDYQDKHREMFRAANRASAKKYKEKRRVYNHQYRLDNLDEVREKVRQYHYDHPEKTREKARRRRAVRQGNGIELYTEQQVLELYGNSCHLCNLPIDLQASRGPGEQGWQNGLHIDHVIPISQGGPDTLSNVRPAHGLCNISRGTNPVNPIERHQMSDETTTPAVDTEVDAAVEAPVVEETLVADDAADAPVADDAAADDSDADDAEDEDDEDIDFDDFDDEDDDEDDSEDAE
jgi:5-methylcytosine-specific restriction endonuclease McrA